jgi:uncharacterized membrane protein
MNSSTVKRLIRTFLNGLLITVPLVVTAYIIWAIFQFFDGLLPVERKFPGQGLLILIGVIFLIGILGKTLIADPIQRRFELILQRVPLVKTIYSAITDLMSAFVGQKKSFKQPVLVKINGELDVERIGFITDSELDILDNPEGKVAIYFPHAYSYTGDVYIVDVKRVTLLNKNAGEVMKYIISGGISETKKDHDPTTEKPGDAAPDRVDLRVHRDTGRADQP